MKVTLKDLKKAVAWVEANTRDEMVKVQLMDNDRGLTLKCQDKYEVQVEISLFADGAMGARIKKEDAL